MDLLEDYKINGDKQFRYQMLGRLISDVQYYIDYGPYRSMWTKDINIMLDLIEALLDSFSKKDKPKWFNKELLRFMRMDILRWG